MKFFTNVELRDLIIAIIALALIFSFPDITGFLLALVIVFFSYFIHELGHKFAARNFGCLSTFKIWPTGIFLGIMSMLFRLVGGWSIVFAAPGFVEIMPYSFGRWGFKVAKLGPKEIGIISLAGVGVNVLFAIIFRVFPDGIFRILSDYNGFLALFNLLPIPPLDGSKIFMWRMWIWLFLIFVTVLTIFVF
jgi:Zn-dependent protease